jgi:sulfonate transport system substrate-binding protein
LKKLLSSLLAITLLAGVNFAFAQEEKPKVIRIGSAAGGGHGKPFSSGIIGIVHARGLLDEEFKNDGIKIEWYFLKGGGPAANEAVANNTIDFLYQGDFSTLAGKAGGLKTKILAAGSVRGNFYLSVVANSPYNSIEDLKGKRIGVFKGTPGQLTFNRFVNAHGLSEKDFNIINLDGADQQAALASKEVDAAVGSFFNLRDQGLTRIIYSSVGNPQFQEIWKSTMGLLVTEEFADKYPDIVKRVVRVYVEAAKWGSEEENREEVFKLWAKVGTPYSNIVETNAGKPMKLINTPVIDEFFTHHYKEALIFAKEQGLIKKTFEVEKWIDAGYVNTALKELELENYWPYFDKDGERRIR